MSFSNVNVTPDYSTAKSMVIAFQDSRKEVLDGKEKPTWVGHLNSTAQIDYNMQTESGRDLAEEFSGSVVSSLNSLGIRAEQLIVPLRFPNESILTLYKSKDKERLLLFHVNQWEASAIPRFSTIRYEVFYKFLLQVYDKEGNQLASSEARDVARRDENQLASNLKYLQRMADEVFAEQVNALLNDLKVKAVLQ